MLMQLQQKHTAVTVARCVVELWSVGWRARDWLWCPNGGAGGGGGAATLTFDRELSIRPIRSIRTPFVFLLDARYGAMQKEINGGDWLVVRYAIYDLCARRSTLYAPRLPGTRGCVLSERVRTDCRRCRWYSNEVIKKFRSKGIRRHRIMLDTTTRSSNAPGCAFMLLIKC